MDIGGLLAGAGRVGVGMREEQEARRVAAANQVALERLRRQEQAALDFSRRAQVTPVQVNQIPALDQQFRFPLGAAAPVAPTVTAPAARTGSAPTPAPTPTPARSPTAPPALPSIDIGNDITTERLTGAELNARIAALGDHPNRAKLEARLRESEASFKQRIAAEKNPQRITSQAEFNNLPEGTVYQLPNGIKGIKGGVAQRSISTPTPTAAPAAAPTAAPTRSSLEPYVAPGTPLPNTVGALRRLGEIFPTTGRIFGLSEDRLYVDPVTKEPISYEKFIEKYPQGVAPTAAAPTTQPKPAPTTQPAAQRPPSPAAPTKKQLDDAPQVSELATQLKPGDLYRADPQAITFDMQQFQQQQQLLVQQRNELAQLANMYLQMATPESIAQFTNLKTAINQLDIQNLQLNANAMYLQGAQGIRELELANDPRRLQAVMSQYAGVPIGLQPNQDGSYNMYVNGQLNERARNISSSNLINYAQLLIDESAREALKQNAAAEAKLAMEAKYGIQRDVAKVVAETSKAIQTALVEGTIRERIAQIEAQSKGKVSFSPEGLIVYNAPDGMVYEISPERIDAKTGIRTPTSAKPVLFR